MKNRTDFGILLPTWPFPQISDTYTIHVNTNYIVL